MFLGDSCLSVIVIAQLIPLSRLAAAPTPGHPSARPALLSAVGVPFSSGNVPQCIGTTCLTPSSAQARAAPSGPIVNRSPIGRNAISGSVDLADQSHVAEQIRIARVVDRPPIFQPDDEAARLAHVDHLATINESAAVTGVRHRDDEPGDLLRPALVHRRGVLDAFALKPVAQLVDGHNGCARGACTADEIFDVIGVPMRGENQVNLRRLLQSVWTRWIRRQPRVQQQPLTARGPQ